MRREQAILPSFIIILGSFLFIYGASAKMLISRIQIAGVSTTDEYIELYNFASTSENLAGWSLTKQTAGGTQNKLVSAFSDSAIINPFSYFLVAHRDYIGISPDLLYTNTSYSLASNNSLLLYNSLGEAVDRVDWGSASTASGLPAPNPDPGACLIRLPNDIIGNGTDTDNSSADFILGNSIPFNSLSPSRPFYDSSFTPPSSTGDTTPPTTTENQNPIETTHWEFLKLSEAMPNPSIGDEWVEIFNSSSSTINLAGATICDNRSIDTCTILNLDGEIAANEYKIFYITGSKLNNDGDSIILKNPADEIIDEISYGESNLPTKGNSLARENFATNVWKVTTQPTPGAENIILLPPIFTTSNTVVNTGGSYLWTAPLEISKKTSSILTSNDKTTILWSINYPKNLYTNSSTLFDSHLSADPRGGEILYSWNMGDGTTIEGSKIYHSYASSGIFSVTIAGTSTQGTVGTKLINIKVNSEIMNKTGVYIDEISAKPENGDEEWVSIRSNVSSSTDLAGWKLGIGDDKWYILPTKTVLKPFGLLKFYKPVTKLSLNNSGGSVLLANSEGAVIDILSFGKSKAGEIISSDLQADFLTTTISVASGKVLGQKISALPNKILTSSGILLADARILPVKSKVVLAGTVVSLPNKPYANYFYVNDISGGIQIYSYKKIFPTLNIGDKVKISGEISFLQGVPRVRISSLSQITNLNSSSTVSAEQKNIIDLDENDFGKLLTIEGEITDLNSSSFYLDDTTAEILVGMPVNANILKNKLSTGLTVKISGIVEQSAGGFRITPRQDTDVEIINKATNKPNPGSSTAKTAVGAGGGLFLIGLGAALRKWKTKK